MKGIAKDVLLELNKTVEHKANVKIADLHLIKADYALIYYAFTNLISNAVKYSAKTQNPTIEIWSEEKKGEIIYAVRDNGVGFEVKAVLTKKRNGLRNMKERVQKYKTGKFEIYSKPNNGTTLLFQLPMNE